MTASGHHVDTALSSSQLVVHDSYASASSYDSSIDLDPDEQDMTVDSNPRLVKMSTLTDVNELHKTIERNYNVTSPTVQNEETVGNTPPLKPYQLSCDTMWNDHDLDDLSYDMTQEMHRLMNESILGPDHKNIMHIEIKQITTIIPTISTNLVHDTSWETPRIEDEREAMKKQMFHLATESNTWQ
eukprot:226446_1